jgi:hypothetical protein
MEQIKRHLVAVAFVISALMVPRAASALITLPSPWHESQRVRVIVGAALNNQLYVQWFNYETGQCFADPLGVNGSLTDDVLVIGSRGQDNMQVQMNRFAGPADALCATAFTGEFSYNGHFIDLAGNDESDSMMTGNGDTWLFGDRGRDTLYGYTPVGRLLGGPDGDFVFGHNSIATDWLEGGDGDDLVCDGGNNFFFSCGGGTDQYAGGSHPSCESLHPTCKGIDGFP